MGEKDIKKKEFYGMVFSFNGALAAIIRRRILYLPMRVWSSVSDKKSWVVGVG